MLSTRKYDIALVDVKLPCITGLDLSWCYDTSLVEGGGEVTAHDTIMIACTSDIDPKELYEQISKIKFFVDAFHFKNHDVKDTYCRENTNPALFPESVISFKPAPLASCRHMATRARARSARTM